MKTKAEACRSRSNGRACEDANAAGGRAFHFYGAASRARVNYDFTDHIHAQIPEPEANIRPTQSNYGSHAQYAAGGAARVRRAGNHGRRTSMQKTSSLARDLPGHRTSDAALFRQTLLRHAEHQPAHGKVGSATCDLEGAIPGCWHYRTRDCMRRRRCRKPCPPL